eukprot:2519373-Rhodomonas_salina.4
MTGFSRCAIECRLLRGTLLNLSKSLKQQPLRRYTSRPPSASAQTFTMHATTARYQPLAAKPAAPGKKPIGSVWRQKLRGCCPKKTRRRKTAWYKSTSCCYCAQPPPVPRKGLVGPGSPC